MDRRSFLTMLGSSILGLFLPKVSLADEKKEDERKRISKFLESCDCSGSEDWSLHDPCMGSEYVFGIDPGQGDYTAWMRYPPVSHPSDTWSFDSQALYVDPVEALVEPYPTLVEALEEIRRICCDSDLWRMPAEYVVIMSPEQFDWYYENIPWFSFMVDFREKNAADV